MPPLLEVRGLQSEFRTGAGVVRAVDGISCAIECGPVAWPSPEPAGAAGHVCACFRSGELRHRCRGGGVTAAGETPLDASIRVQAVDLLEDLGDRPRFTCLFVAHDPSFVRHLCRRVAVIYPGRTAGMVASDESFDDPLHPPIQALPIPDPRIEAGRVFRPPKRKVPSPINPPSGRVFHPRCPKAVDACKAARPELREVRPGHRVARGEVH